MQGASKCIYKLPGNTEYCTIWELKNVFWTGLREGDDKKNHIFMHMSATCKLSSEMMMFKNWLLIVTVQRVSFHLIKILISWVVFPSKKNWLIHQIILTIIKCTGGLCCTVSTKLIKWEYWSFVDKQSIMEVIYSQIFIKRPFCSSISRQSSNNKEAG